MTSTERDLVMSTKKQRVAWPVEHWPAADQAAWQRAQMRGNPLTKPGKAASWRPTSRKAVIGAYGRWLAYLADHGLLEETATPATRMNAELVYPYVDHLRTTCSSVTVASYLGMLCMMIQAMAPGVDFIWLQELQKHMKIRAVPIREKRQRIVPIGDLAQLGLDLMAEAEAKAAATGISRHEAKQYRDGLMIALLASRPLRQANFLGIDIGCHLISLSSGYMLSFTADETKTHRPLAFAVPSYLVPLLTQYCALYRPYLLALRSTRGKSRQDRHEAAGNRLWVSQYGTPMTAGAQIKMLKKHTVSRFGRFVNPHLFRDCVATSIANESPEHVRITAQILGHSSLDTTEHYYIQAKANIATAQYHDQVLAIRTAGSGGRRQRGRSAWSALPWPVTDQICDSLAMAMARSQK